MKLKIIELIGKGKNKQANLDYLKTILNNKNITLKQNISIKEIYNLIKGLDKSIQKEIVNDINKENILNDLLWNIQPDDDLRNEILMKLSPKNKSIYNINEIPIESTESIKEVEPNLNDKEEKIELENYPAKYFDDILFSMRLALDNNDKQNIFLIDNIKKLFNKLIIREKDSNLLPISEGKFKLDKEAIKDFKRSIRSAIGLGLKPKSFLVSDFDFSINQYQQKENDYYQNLPDVSKGEYNSYTKKIINSIINEEKGDKYGLKNLFYQALENLQIDKERKEQEILKEEEKKINDVNKYLSEVKSFIDSNDESYYNNLDYEQKKDYIKVLLEWLKREINRKTNKLSIANISKSDLNKNLASLKNELEINKKKLVEKNNKKKEKNNKEEVEKNNKKIKVSNKIIEEKISLTNKSLNKTVSEIKNIEEKIKNLDKIRNIYKIKEERLNKKQLPTEEMDRQYFDEKKIFSKEDCKKFINEIDIEKLEETSDDARINMYQLNISGNKVKVNNKIYNKISENLKFYGYIRDNFEDFDQQLSILEDDIESSSINYKKNIKNLEELYKLKSDIFSNINKIKNIIDNIVTQLETVSSSIEEEIIKIEMFGKKFDIEDKILKLKEDKKILQENCSEENLRRFRELFFEIQNIIQNIVRNNNFRNNYNNKIKSEDKPKKLDKNNMRNNIFSSLADTESEDESVLESVNEEESAEISSDDDDGWIKVSKK